MPTVHVFVSIYSIIIEKEVYHHQNIFSDFTCLCVCLSSGDLM